MLSIFFSAVLLVLIVFAVVVFWRRTQGAQPDVGQPAQTPMGPTTVTLLGNRADYFPKTAARQEEFDPDATQAFLRSSNDFAATGPQKREGQALKAPGGARLVGLSGRHKGRSFSIATDGITVGRSPTCGVVLTDPRVSSNHAWVGIVDAKPLLRDLKSKNGTFLNAQIHASVTEVELRSGDTIFFGGHGGDQFRFVTNERRAARRDSALPPSALDPQ
jgi:hypothetical protein